MTQFLSLLLYTLVMAGMLYLSHKSIMARLDYKPGTIMSLMDQINYDVLLDTRKYRVAITHKGSTVYTYLYLRDGNYLKFYPYSNYLINIDYMGKDYFVKFNSGPPATIQEIQKRIHSIICIQINQQIRMRDKDECVDFRKIPFRITTTSTNIYNQDL